MRFKTIFRAIIATVVAASSTCFQASAFKEVVKTSAVGDVTIACSNDNGWKVSTEYKAAEGKEYIKIKLSNSILQTPPQFNLSFITAQKDMHHVWFSETHIDRCHLKPDWSKKYQSALAQNMPIYALLNENNRNRLTLACDEYSRAIETKFGVKEEECRIYAQMNFFIQPEAPLSEYETTVMLDNRDVFWAEPITESAAWISDSKGIKACNVPESAFDPLYSSWYQFHQKVNYKEIEAESEIAAKLGMKTLIIDDGWQTDDTNKGYAFCGDWNLCDKKFSNMREHVRKVQGMGIKYLMWYSVPFIGYKSANYERFQGKYLYHKPGLSTAVLDPRFPEVRDFLCNVYVKAMKEWGLDGFKLDFIDSFKFEGDDPAVAENYAGRDIKSVPAAVDVLMKEVVSRLSAINPDVLLEFRQSYIGPGIRQYGNMFRAGDCPGDLQGNRIRTANIRLTAGNSATHADMIIWNKAESKEDAARPLISALFSVIQYSVMLRETTPDQIEMIKHWIDFTQKHRDALLKGYFKPYHPEACYPVLEAGNDSERIMAVYTEGTVVRVPDAKLSTIIVNGTGEPGMIVELPAKTGKANIYDCCGKLVSSVKTAKGLQSLPVPVSGYITL